MKTVVMYSFVLLLTSFISACSPPAAAQVPVTAPPTAVAPTLTAQQPTPLTPAANPTAPAPSQTAPATDLTPVGFNAYTHNEFVQTMVYYNDAINAAIGADLLDAELTAFAYSADGSRVAFSGCFLQAAAYCFQETVGEALSFLVVVDAQTAAVIATSTDLPGFIYSMAFTADAQQLLLGSSPSMVSLWDVNTRQVTQVVWDGGAPSTIVTVASSSDDAFIAAVADRQLLVWDAETSDLVLQSPAYRFGQILPQFSADGSRLVIFTQAYGAEITVFDTTDWTVVSTIRSDLVETNFVSLAPDGRTLAGGSFYPGEPITLWNVDSGTLLHSLTQEFQLMDQLTFLPDGASLLASGHPQSANATEGVLFWETDSGALLGIANLPYPLGRIQFAADAASFTARDTHSPVVFRWSQPDPASLRSRAVLTDFLAALKSGDFALASEHYAAADYDLEDLDSLGLDSTDVSAALAGLCTLTSGVCGLTPHILYQGVDLWDETTFLVRFTDADGAVYVTADGVQTFYYFLTKSASGQPKLTALPLELYAP